MMINQVFCESLDSSTGGGSDNSGQEKQVHRQSSYQPHWGGITAS